MQFKTLLMAAIAATVMAQYEGDSLALQLASLTSQLGSLSLSYPTSELSMASVLAEAMPESILTAISNPAVQSSLASDMEAGNTPAWYNDLPEDVKSYLNSVGSQTTNLPLSSVASSLTAGASSLQASASSELAAATASATSTGGAPAPTSAIVASMVGIVGVLALAIGL